ncbi:hypothetical protein TNIN_452711 [Trichonephila inaurata madagascariensis]|uniref:Uncharacterized protein n=1 Tax=Trichonephila inaurata madagascariensis TaxID=2747483 RepID=A0A8X7CQ60_9ARAC|nr:hypothetical protein TNIN_452711 [Trichonephila inaurata madagascariensis]
MTLPRDVHVLVADVVLRHLGPKCDHRPPIPRVIIDQTWSGQCTSTIGIINHNMRFRAGSLMDERFLRLDIFERKYFRFLPKCRAGIEKRVLQRI